MAANTRGGKRKSLNDLVKEVTANTKETRKLHFYLFIFNFQPLKEKGDHWRGGQSAGGAHST